jgi:DNA topoisomerase-1
MTRHLNQQKYPEHRPLRLSAGDTVLVRSRSTHRGLRAGDEAWVTASTSDLDALVKSGQVELVGQDAPKAKAAAKKAPAKKATKKAAAKKSAKKRAPAKKAAPAKADPATEA